MLGIASHCKMAIAAIAVGASVIAPAIAADLAEIQQRGQLRHIGIRYANFVTGSGDGFDVELMQGFAKAIGVEYKLVYSDFYNVLRDLLGKDVVRSSDGAVELVGEFEVKGDVIASGFTVLPWRREVVLYSDPVFPSQVVLVATAQSPVKPIAGSDDLVRDIQETKALIGTNSLLVMNRTCLDPANYGLTNGVDLKAYAKSTNLNEMVPALITGQADLSLLDVPNAILDLKKWAGQIKILGPISERQDLAVAFPKDAPKLRDAFNDYLRAIKADGTYIRLVERYYPDIRGYFPDVLANGK